MIGHDGLWDVLEEGGLSGAWWGDDEAALPTPDWGDHVDDACGEALLGGLKLDALVGIDGLEFFEERQVSHCLWGATVDFTNLCDLGAA